MSKKIFVLLLSVFIMLFAVSAAMGANGYTLAGSDKADPDDPEAYDNNPEYGYAGGSYSATYSKPELVLWGYDEIYEDDDEQWRRVNASNYTISWTLSPDISGLAVTESSDASGDILVISGTLPSDVTTYEFGFVATVADVTNSNYSDAEGKYYFFDTSESLEVLSGDIVYRLATSEGPEEDPEDPDGTPFDNTEEGYTGTNYKATYTRPEIVLWEYRSANPDDENERCNMLTKTSFDIVWTLSPDIEGLSFTIASDDTYDTLILSGTLPDEAKTYECDVVATVANVTDETYKTKLEDVKYVFTQIVTVDVLEDTDHETEITSDSSNFSDYVTPAGGVTVTSVDENYSVVVNAPKDNFDYYTAFIQSDDSYTINIPEWLTISSVTYAEESDLNTDNDISMSDFDATPIKSITLTFNSVAGLKNGTTGSVRVPYYDDEGYTGEVLTWNVTYTGDDIAEEEKTERPFGISGSGEVSLSFTSAGTKSQDVSYYGTTSVITQLATDLRPNVELSFKQSKAGYTGTITVTATVPSTAEEGNYETSFKIIDANDTTRSADIPVTVSFEKSSSGSSSSFDLTADKSELNLTAGNSGTVALTIEGTTSGTVTWSSEYDTSALTVAIASGSSLATITANDSAAEGSYTVKLTAKDNVNSKSVSIIVNVTSSGGEDPKDPEDPEDPYDPYKAFNLSSDVTEFNLEVDDSRDITITATTRVVEWDWLVSGDEHQQSGITVDIKSSDISADITVNVDKETEAGDYVIIITATNAAEKEAKISFDLTVNDFDLELTTTSTDIELTAGGDSKNLTITSNKTIVSWDISAGSGVTVSITEQTNKTAVITLTPGATAASDVCVVTITAQDRAGNEESITLNVTVSNPVSEFTVTASPASLALTAGGDSGKSTITASDGYHDSISWSITSNPSGISASLSNSTGVSTDVTVSALASATSGDYSLVVTATDGYATKKTATINIKVSVKGSFTITASPSTLELTAGGYSKSVSLSTNGVKVGSISYKFECDDSSLTFAKTEGSNLLFITASNTTEEGEKTVTVTATDESGATASTTITVTVKRSGGGGTDTPDDPENPDDPDPSVAFALSSEIKEVSFDLAAIAENELTITANKKVISWDWVVSGDEDKKSGITVEITSSDMSADIAVNVEEDTAAGEYELIISAFDAYGASADITLTLTVTDSSAEVFTISADPASLDFVVNGEPKTVTVTANRQSIAWVINDVEDFTAEITASDDTSVTITVTPGSVALEGLVSVAGMDADYNISSTDVTIKIEEGLILTPNPESINLFVGGSSKDITVNTNKSVVSWDISYSIGITAEITASEDKSATITVTPGSEASSYTVTVKALDESGTEKTVEINVTVTSASASEELTLTASPTTLSLTAGGSSRDITITANNTVTSWSVSSASGITTAITESDDKMAIVTVTPGTRASRYTVRVTATDEAGTSKTLSVTVTVSTASSGAFTLSATPLTLSLVAGGEALTSRITAGSGYTGTLRWSYSAPSGISVALSNTTGTNTTATVTATTAATSGPKSVVITATDSNGASSNVTLTVNVITSGGNSSADVIYEEAAAQIKKDEFIRNNSYATPRDIDDTVVENMTNAIRGLFNNPSIGIQGLKRSDFSTNSKTVSDTNIQSDFANSNEVPVLAINELPSDVITESKIYIFAIDFNDFVKAVEAGLLNYGSPIFVHMRPESADVVSGSVSVAALRNDDKGIFVDDSGNEITTLPSSNTNGINIAAYLEAGNSYSPVISTKSGDVSGDIGASGAGCNGGFGALFGILAMAFTASSLYIRKRS